MPNIQKYSDNIPSLGKLNLTKLYFQEADNNFDIIELIISIEQTGVNVKELSSYLDFIYRVDGHLSEIGYSKYVHNPRLQIEIDDIRFGSWEIVFQKLLNSIDGDKLFIIYLSLKFLPKVIQTLLDAGYRFYEILDIREDYLEKKEKRKYRKTIRQLIADEQRLSGLHKRQKEKLVDLLDKLYSEIGNRTVAASRFAKKFIKELKIISAKKKDNS